MPTSPNCRLYLQVPALNANRVVANLTHAIETYDVACLLLTAQEDGNNASRADFNRIDIDWAANIRTLAHAHDIAFLLEDDAAQARTLMADGVHMPADFDRYTSAREQLGKDAIIGVNCVASRHDAMLLAERGANYVAFPMQMQNMPRTDYPGWDLISWWSEVFELPCVAWDIETVDQAKTAVEAGADFISLKKNCLKDPEFAERMAEIASAMKAFR